MIVDTTVFGAAEVEEDQIFRMPQGLFGFEKSGRYALLTKRDGDVTLMWFQAVDTKVPCFVVFNPYEIIDGYQPVLETGDLRAMDSSNAEDLEFLVIAVVPEDITRITVNLKSPIVLNRETHTARQVILTNDYPIKFALAPCEEAVAAGR